ncbi:MAG: hypothetical protein K2P76_00820 [Lachnospiraceae bacterium]|nr:hypothetical protein [Lachnospiraceae bacterium]MDE6980446.1 hypothetical protein [Lachnospiraceae bacterium]
MELALFLSAFVAGITNPAAILTFLFAFSYFNLTEGMTVLNGALAGTFIWWLLLSFAAGRFREKTVRHRILWMDRPLKQSEKGNRKRYKVHLP